jgi:hypothetical protein
MPKNPSPAQRAASRANGSKSRGALSPETKSISCQNAKMLGLFARTLALPHKLQASVAEDSGSPERDGHGAVSLSAAGDPLGAAGSEGAGDAPGAGPPPASREGAKGSQNEPEDGLDASTQILDDSGISIDGRPFGLERQNGVLSLEPAVQETPSGAVTAGGRSERAGDHSSRAVQPVPTWVDAIPLLAPREGAEGSQNEPEDLPDASTQSVDGPMGSVDSRCSARS